MRPGKASPPSELCFFICKGIIVICDNCKDRLDVSRQKGFGISKVTFYRSGGDVLLVSCFGRELLGQGGGSHNHVQFGAMFRNLGVHSGDKRSGETWWLSFLGPQSETGTFEAARGQKKPHRPPTPKTPLLLCSASVHKQRWGLWSVGEAASTLPGPGAAPWHWGWSRKWARGWDRGQFL